MSEIDEVETTPETTEPEMDEDLAAELDSNYDAYNAEDDPEKAEELDSKYDSYIEDDTDKNTEDEEHYGDYVESGKTDDPDAAGEIKCRNESLEGKTHPETGVPFERREVEVDGKQVEVVVPRFESEYDAQLPEDMYKSTDHQQFKECNAQLKEAVATDEELRSRFDEEQLDQIENGEIPDGYTWHHDAEPGKMQLVDTETHQRTGHTGGRNIWGGGTENR